MLLNPQKINLAESFNIKPFLIIDKNNKKDYIATVTHPNGSYIKVNLNTSTITKWTTSDGNERIWSTNYKHNQLSNTLNCYGISPSFPTYGKSLIAELSTLPKNGITREMNWTIISTCIVDCQCDPRPTMLLRLRDTIKSRAIWSSEFELEFKISLGLNLIFNRLNKKDQKIDSWKKRIVAISRKVRSKLISSNERKAEEQSTNLHEIEAWFTKQTVKKNNKEIMATAMTSKEVGYVSNEGIIAKRRRLEKERGQPAYFKYKITSNKYISPSETFHRFGFPEDLHLSLSIRNLGSTPFTCTTGLLTHFVIPPASNKFSQTLGLGYLPFIDVAKYSSPKIGMDRFDNLFFCDEPIDRWYTDTMRPNEIFFATGDESHIHIISRDGFNNVHVWYPRDISSGIFVRLE
eukprot:gnl/TRDRNA2_/TRDRNA2_177065_c1_seq1.p1 gnl/TRDRNA2_/TRDRNA2_177065_c1~~gnl/TRDRNA2_/TRDRNA2_177065_c1_seq1.p1  ORF type:complete len:405 (+),score=-24.47 gnl/TRDRNA2_/TRDRNA2_177065_c1_seq1:37-1251(+)